MPLTRQLLFHGMQSSWTLLAHGTAIGLTLILIVLLLRYERRLVSRTIGNTLLGLRLAVLAVILLTLLQPVLSWTLDQTRIGRILIGVDLSDSMSTNDTHAMRSEKLRWARGLGMIGNASVNHRLDRWQKAFEEGREPEWVDETEVADETKRRELAASRRDHTLGVFKELDAIPRREIARRLLSTTPKPLLEALKSLGKLELFAFAGKTEAIETGQLDAAIATPSRSLLTETSDLSLALQTSSNASGNDVMGIVLFTDGRDQSGKNLTALAASLKAANVPVFPVVLGSFFRPKDLSIASLEYPQAAYKSDHPQLKATINTNGFEGRSIEIELVRENVASDDDSSKETEMPLKKTVQVVGPSVSVEFELNASEIGRKAYILKTPVLEGETRDDNNSRSFAFAVVDDHAKVLLVEGDARWEFRYIDAALTRDERVDLKTVLFQQPYMGVLNERYIPNQIESAPPGDKDDQSPFANLDLVILGDVPPQYLSNQFWDQLRTFVTEGGTLVISGGKRWMPLGHRSEILDQLLPITNLRPVMLTDRAHETTPQMRGLPLQLTVDGEQQPMLQFAADPIQNQNIWTELPGQTWMLLGDPKPAATVWTTTRIQATVLDPLQSDRRHAAIVHQHLGSGQVVWMGFDGTWRWRHRVGDEYHHRFWGQLARWAAANKVTAGNEFVRFGPDSSDIELGRDVVLRAKWMAPFLQKFPKLKAKADVFRMGDQTGRPFTSIDLNSTDGRSLLHEGKAIGLPAGEYRVVLSTENADLGPKPVETTLYVHDRPSLELSDLSANRDLLVQIADTSGGRLFQVDELEDLPKQFKSFDATTSLYEETTLWDRWPCLILLLTLLTVEWVIRKLNGLP